MSGVSTKLKDKIPGYNSLVKPVHLARAVVAGARYGFPAKGLTVIGVTGTNGKTTTCFMIWKMLNESGRPAGLMTTVAWGYKKLAPELNHMTTVDSMTLNERILKIKEAGAKYLVLEVTSHAMEQFRTLGVPVEMAVFTNLTHDHLDYHKTLEKYRRAKCKLFRKAKFGVVNADDKSARFFGKACKKSVSYGISRGDLRAVEVKNGVMGVEYKVEGLEKIEEDTIEVGGGNFYRNRGGLDSELMIRTKIPGVFNVYNSLAAVAVGKKLGLSGAEIERGILSLESVEGRMNRIEEGQDFSVIVDYAHTPDALEKVFEAIGEMRGRVIVVHGGAGRRDESTREERGWILGKNADVVIITEDDSRDEDPARIAEQFVRGAERAGKVLEEDLLLELDRGEAIKKAVYMAKPGDLVLLLGKGHEKSILRGDRVIPFQDIKVAKKWIRARLAEEKEPAKKPMKEPVREVKVKKEKKAVESGKKKEVMEKDKEGRRIKRGLRLKRKVNKN